MNMHKKRMVSNLIGEGGVSVLTTCGEDRMAHASWMNALVTDGLREVIAVTSPMSKKVINLRENPLAEWMFSSPGFETIVHLSGKTEVVEDLEEAQACWDRVPGKANGYYRLYRKPDDFRDFTMIRTIVTEIQLVKPMGYRKIDVEMDDVVLCG